MSWSELERLVEDAERDGRIARALRHCRSRTELVLAACRLGYAVVEADLDLARGLESPSVRCGQPTAVPHATALPPSARPAPPPQRACASRLAC